MNEASDAAGDAVKRISSNLTFAIKLTPFLYFAFLAFFVALTLTHGFLPKAPVFIIVPCMMAVFGYQYWKTSVRDLVDEVDDCGDYLLVKKSGEEDTVLLSNITNVNFTTDRQGAQGRITLRLASPGKFGTAISFAPPPHIYLSFPRRNEIADDLLVRADRARSGHAA